MNSPPRAAGFGDGPKVTVIIPTRDRPHLFRRALASALQQEAVDVEVVVVIDGAEEKVARLVHALCERVAVVIRHNRAEGLAAANNAGAKRATTAWLAFLEDDDIWAPRKLATQVAAAESSGAGWSFAGSVLVDENLDIVGAQQPSSTGLLERLLSSDVVPAGGSSVLVRRELFENAGGFDPSFGPITDWELWIRLALCSSAAAIGRPMVAYTVHGGSSTVTNRAWREALLLLETKHQDLRESLDRYVDWVVWFRWLASRQLGVGKRSTAARLLIEAARHGGGARDLVRALVVLSLPGVKRFAKNRARRSVPSGWETEAREWLTPYAQEL